MFFFVITKNLNWETEDEKFEYCGGSLKNPNFRRGKGSRKRKGLGDKERMVFSRERGVIPQSTLWSYLQYKRSSVTWKRTVIIKQPTFHFKLLLIFTELSYLWPSSLLVWLVRPRFFSRWITQQMGTGGESLFSKFCPINVLLLQAFNLLSLHTKVCRCQHFFTPPLFLLPPPLIQKCNPNFTLLIYFRKLYLRYFSNIWF